jgi:light-regulated signal transduction histidine kinase (bacteriophytochrome)
VELVFDYRVPPPSASDEQALPWHEPLLACFQKALGHELPNRLVAVQGLARLLLLDKASQLDAEGRDYLERLAAAVRQADEMVRALAELGRQLRDPELPIELDLEEVVREAAAQVRVLYPGREFEYHVAGAPTVLILPRQKWLLAFALLLRYTLECASGERTAHLDVAARQTEGETEIAVTGIKSGGAEADLAAQFEPFARGSTTVTQGLALFPLRLLAAGSRGLLRVVQEPERGIQFLFRFPG